MTINHLQKDTEGQQRMKYNLDFTPSYGQFYLFDKDKEGATDSPNFWSKAAFESGLALEKGVIGVSIASYRRVRLEVEVFDIAQPILDFDKWDRITEGSLKIKTGYIQVLDCPNSEVQLEIKVEKGAYRIRVYGANFASVVGDDGEDFYRLEIWSASYEKRKVMKKYNK